MNKVLHYWIIGGLFAACWGEPDYTVDPDVLEPFEGESESFVDFTDAKIVKRERLLNGTLVFLEDMDDEQYKISVELFSNPAGDGNYKKMTMEVPPTKLCEAMKKFYIPFVQPSMRKDQNTDFPYIPDEGLCPLPAGSYYIKDIALNTERWPDSVPRGPIKAVITFWKNDKNVGGMVVILKIDDK